MTATTDILAQTDWLARRAAHESRVDPWLAPHLARSSRGERHPIHDFLFEYYSYRPARLRRWHPGIGVALAGEVAEEFLAIPHYARLDGGIGVSTATLKPERFAFVRWLLGLLEAVRDRPPFFGCAGLHEWAMVHRAEEVRHPQWPLRLGAAGTSAVLESLPVRCSHHDAFRFFTPEARPLNRLQPTRPEAHEMEQSGCLHANMDLYKWASKLAPFTPSELTADTFALARDIRELDMRASPYDFSALGFEPVAIETPEGRAAYEHGQREFSAQSAPLRKRLIAVCQALLAAS
ncbi:MAG: 3-methyladenine DNA glycosylase [Chthoniobacterales bacterium]